LSGCGKATFNGKPGEFCGKGCRQSYAAKASAASLTDYNAVKFMAEQWVRSVWPRGLGNIKKFYRNPGLGDKSCPAAAKYQRGVIALGQANISTAEFAWHGTASLAGVQGICWDNLDPQRRAGQAYGRGEYFSVDANVSAGYAGSVGYIIVCLLLTGRHNTTHNGTYRVVDNPQDGNTMYCVPVGVVDYLANSDPQLRGSGTP